MNNQADDEKEQPMVLLLGQSMNWQVAEQPYHEPEGGLGSRSLGNDDAADQADGQQTLQHLLAAIVEQDQSAFTQLYDIMLARVYGLALRITRNTQTAEEVTEDAFWQVWRQAPRFDPERGNPVAWILTIARSRALDALRRQDDVDTETADDELINMPAAGLHDPQDLLAAIQEGHCLQTALAMLEPVARQLLALSFFQGLSHDEIARHTGMPLGTVKSQIRRALASLKQHLQHTPIGSQA